MDSRRLLTFRVVAHERSFSRAAEKLSLSQPSVSHQVALLETEIGLRLLDRGRGGLRLTHAGDVLLEHADHVAWRLQMADTQISALAQERRDQVRLGAFPTALTGFVPAAIGRLRSTNSDLQVLLSEVTPSRLEPRFLAGEFDLAVSYQDAESERRELEGAERVDLLQETFMVGMPPTHRLADTAGPVPLAEFADDDWIVPSREGFLVQACLDAGFTPRIVSITPDPIATRGLISRGIGVGWVPSLLSDDFEEAVMRPIDGPMRRRDIYALFPPGDRHPLAADMLNALVETATEFGGEA
jgi:DNA-binding transcriptional LysR family regulator